MTMKETPTYIKSLVIPTAKKRQGRRVWSIDLETVWLPFFTATNTMGDTSIPAEALGAPLRLQFDKDGSVRFSDNGRPQIRVARPISEAVSIVRENFTANLLSYAEQVATEREKEYVQTVKIAQKAGKPIIAYDNKELSKAIQQRLEAEMEAAAEPEAEAEAPEAKEPVAVA